MSNKDDGSPILILSLICIGCTLLGGVLTQYSWENKIKHNRILNVNSKYYKIIEVKPTYNEVKK